MLGGSNKYPQFMFGILGKTKSLPCRPHIYYIKVGYNGVIYISRTCYPDAVLGVLVVNYPETFYFWIKNI